MKIRRSMLERVLREELKNILAEKALLKEWPADQLMPGPATRPSTPKPKPEPEEVETDTSDITPAGDTGALDWLPTSVVAKAKEKAEAQALQDTEDTEIVAAEWDAARFNAINSYGGENPTRESIEDGAGSRATIDWIQKNIQGGGLSREQAQDLYLKKYHGDQIKQINRYTAHTAADNPNPDDPVPEGSLGFNRAVYGALFPNARTIVVDPKKHGEDEGEHFLGATMHHEAGHIDPKIMAMPEMPGEAPIKRWDDIHKSNQKLGKSVFPGMPGAGTDVEGGSGEALVARNRGEGTQWAEFTADTRFFRSNLQPGKKVVAGDIVDILSGLGIRGEAIGGGAYENTRNSSWMADEVNDIKTGLLNYEMFDENGKEIERTIRNKKGELIWNPKFLERAAWTMNTIVKTDVPKEKATPSRSYKDTLKDLQPAGSNYGEMVAESKKKGSEMKILFEGWRNFIE